MGFLDGLFDDDGPMGGVVNLPPAKKPGKWRPGLRSTEIAIEQRFGAGKAGSSPTSQAPKTPVTLPALPTRTAGGTYIARTPPPASTPRPPGSGTSPANAPPPIGGGRALPESQILFPRIDLKSVAGA